MRKRVYTLGSSNRGREEFIELLRHYGIKKLVDVRRFPTSRFEHFKRENIERVLRENGIEYLYLGEQLGGYRKKGYQHYTKTKDFRLGLERLMEIAGDNNTAIMCCERLPWRCHRRFIGRELASRGWMVVHVIDKDRTWIQGV
jgi:uncharacterized protein (DUF488 family)